MGITKGLNALKAKQEETAKKIAQGGNFIRRLRLYDDGESARFRLLTVATNEDQPPFPSLFSGEFHSVPRKLKEKTIYPRVLCLADEGECPHCVSGDRPTTDFLAWVWVVDVIHSRDSTRQGVKWEPFKDGKRTMYREVVNAIRLWQGGYTMSLKLASRYGKFGQGTDGLVLRELELERHGVFGTRQVDYDLQVGDQAPLPKEALEALKEVRGLEEVARSEGNDQGKDRRVLVEQGEVALDPPPDEELPF